MLVPVIGLGLFFFLVAGKGKKRRAPGKGDTSDVEAMTDGGAMHYDFESRVGDALGWPYFFGKGTPATPWSDGPKGVDCSGFAQMALVRLGLLKVTAGDRGARALADAARHVDIGDQQPGDLAIYPGHVMVVADFPGTDGHSSVMGASGGVETTRGNDPHARVKLFKSARYRDDFVCYGRLP